MTEKRKEIAFTNYFTALEALLLFDSHTELSFRLNLYVALIAGNNIKGNRIELFDKLKQLYEIRSKIVHTGVTEIDQGDLDFLKRTVINVIFKILLKKQYFTCCSIEDFRNKLKKIILK
jgi:hypothetical protein